MHGPLVRAAATGTLAGVAIYGALRSRFGAPARFAGNLAAAGAAVGAASLLGVGREQLGLAPERHWEGLRWGSLSGGTVAAAVTGLAAVGPARPWFADERVGAHSRGRAVVEASLRIPVETALAEELLFRGAVLGLAERSWGRGAAVAVSSALFGLWHVPPALDALGASAVSGATGAGRSGRMASVAGTVVATSAAGVVLAGLRLRSGSVLAPTIVHAALNVAGFSAARRATAPGAGAGGRGRPPTPALVSC